MIVQGKRALHPDIGKLIVLDAFELGVLGELGASLFRSPKWVRAKDAKVRKAISERFLDHTGWRACGVAGVTGLSEPGYNGGRWRGGVLAGGAIKDRGAIGGMFLYLRVQSHHA